VSDERSKRRAFLFTKYGVHHEDCPDLPDWAKKGLERAKRLRAEREAYNAQWRTDPDGPNNFLFDGVAGESGHPFFREVGQALDQMGDPFTRWMDVEDATDE